MTTVDGFCATMVRGARLTWTATICGSRELLCQVTSPSIIVTGSGARLIGPSLVEPRNRSATTRGNQLRRITMPSTVDSMYSAVQGLTVIAGPPGGCRRVAIGRAGTRRAPAQRFWRRTAYRTSSGHHVSLLPERDQLQSRPAGVRLVARLVLVRVVRPG